MAFQILCFSGGGYLGLYSAAVVAALEQHTGRPIADQFDLVAGTSVGGIIALGLAAGKPAAEIRDAFLEHGPKIFSATRPPRAAVEVAQLLARPTRPKFGQAALRATIEAIVGADLTMGDLINRVIVPAVNLTKGKPQVFKTAHHPTFMRDWRLKVVDVALATAAAPTYFPIHRIGGEMFADGGLYANSPDQLAVHEAEHFLEQPLNELRVLSIGTTTAKFSFSNATGTNLGWLGWMRNQRLTSAMIASQQLNADYILRHKLGDAYLRIDQEQSKEQERELRLDVASESARNDLLGLAEASAREHLPKPVLKAMLAHTAARPVFHHH
jgi:patatin-like phospholipase/acyl hydrolase